MPSMTLKVLLPYEIFITEHDVSSVVVETTQGSFGLLPHRLDCVAALVPGILSFRSESRGEIFLALDEGVLIKKGQEVSVSVRRALRGEDLSHLHDLIEDEFLTVNEQEQAIRLGMARLETSFMHRFASMREVKQ